MLEGHFGSLAVVYTYSSGKKPSVRKFTQEEVTAAAPLENIDTLLPVLLHCIFYYLRNMFCL